MTADETKSLKSMLKETLKPVQGEISRLTTETRGVSERVMHLYAETSKNGRETARLSSDLENMKDWLGEELGTINLKIDALTSDVVDLQNNIGIIRDQFVGVEEKFAEDRKDIKLVKKHIGLAA